MDEHDDEFEEFETPMEDTGLKWLEREMANCVGFMLTLKTYEHDYISGRICGVRSGGVLMVDDKGSKIFCDLGIIALYCIRNPKTDEEQKPPQKAPKAKSKKTPKVSKTLPKQQVDKKPKRKKKDK